MTESSPPSNNTRGLLRSMLVIASAQFLSIIIRILKAKLVAVLLGPSGTGLLSVFANLQMLGSQAAGLGLAQSGVRDLAASRGDAEMLGRLRHVLMITLALQGGIGMAVIWLMREQLSVWLLGEAVHVTEIGLVGVAVLLFLLASSQQTLLRGMRRIGDLGRVMVLGTLAGAVVGMAAVWLMGRDGLIWFLLAEPLGALLVGIIYVRRLPLPVGIWPSLREIWQSWRPMVHLGMAFMLGALLSTATLLLVRTLITRDIGLDAAGQFAAAWTITFVYIGFLAQAMMTDYLPRLIEVIRDREGTNRLVNEQLQLGMVLGGPILLIMVGIAPPLIVLLYSAEFEATATVLQWQLVGAALSLNTRALSSSFIASGRAMLHLYTQVQFNVLFLGAIWLYLPTFGIEATGMAYLFANIMQITMVAILANRLYGFRWQAASFRIFALTLLSMFAMLALARLAPGFAVIVAPTLGVIMALIGVHRVLGKIGSQGRFVSRAHRFYSSIGWPVKRED